MEQQMVVTWAQVGIGVGQLVMIGFGLWQMNKASEERKQQMNKASEDRNRQLDIMEAAQREQSRTQAETLGKIGEGITALLRRPTA